MDKRTVDRGKQFSVLSDQYAEIKSFRMSLIERSEILKLIESYLRSLTNENNPASEIIPLVKSLSGAIVIEDDFDEKEEYTQYLIEKYK